jgi:serine/threonine protein kinase/Flp pilus assembly protein TadD
MADENWNKAKRIFAETIKIAPDERARFLDEICPDDTDTRREVESLLASLDDAGNFMETPAIGEVAESITGETAQLGGGQYIGHYEIIEKIGAGGMGEVYLAKDTRLNRRVALKLLAAHITEDKSRVSRFRQEAFATSALNHPNIVTIYEIGEWQGRDFIVTEFIEGMTLRSLLQKKKLTFGEAFDIALQTASALAAAHGAGIVHRDIKPENIMIRPDGLVKVLDFGIAKYMPSENARQSLVETEVGEVIGTAAYMSPEQARGLEIDARTDIWSLGVILFEMIAGKLPFQGQTKSDRIAAILEREPESLLKIRRKTPPQLEQIIGRALAKDKKQRYPEAADFAEDLQRLRETTGDKQSSPFILPVRKTVAPRRAYLYAAGVLAILLVAAVGFGYYFRSAGKLSFSADNKKSLAVLPFVNSGQDPNLEYLSDGITESVINNLSQITNLRVMSRNSAFRFKRNQTDNKNIAAQLGVETLVTGDIRQIGDKLIINVRLIDASDDSQIWGNQYVKASGDVIAAQNEIAQAVAQNLRLKLSDTEQQQMAKRPTENAEAYQLYLRGRFHVFKLTPLEIQKGIESFQQAINLDPNYARAYAGLADAYRSLAVGSEMSPTEFFPKSKTAALRALELDDTLADGHATLGMTLMWGEWNWGEAENHFKRAIELDPSNTNGHLLYAHLLSNMGRHAEALNEVKRARELDPLFAFAGALEGQFLNHAGRHDEALDRLQKTLELAPNFWMPHIFASSVYTEKGMYSEAVAEARKAKELSPAQTVSEAFGGYALAKLGKSDEARAVLNELLKLSETRFVPAHHLALIYNGLGEPDKTFEWLEKAYQQRDPKMAFLKVEPKWNNLRSDPRFIEIIKRMNLE